MNIAVGSGLTLNSKKSDFYFFDELNTRDAELHAWVIDDGMVILELNALTTGTAEIRVVNHATAREILEKEFRMHHDKIGISNGGFDWLTYQDMNFVVGVTKGLLRCQK